MQFFLRKQGGFLCKLHFSDNYKRVYFRRAWMLRWIRFQFSTAQCYFLILILFLKGIRDHGSFLRGAEKPKWLAVTGTVTMFWVARWEESFGNNDVQIVLHSERRCIVSQNFTSLSWMINIRVCPWTTFIVFLVSHAP